MLLRISGTGPAPSVRNSVRLALLSVLALFAGCALFEPRPPVADTTPAADAGNQARWEQRRASLSALTSWSLQARVATGRIIGWSGNLRWRQQGDDYELVVGGPLGGGLRARGDARSTTITTADGSFETTDPEAYFEREMGWRFPLRQLRYWSLGLPDPNVRASQMMIDRLGRLTQMQQAGWQVSYESYGLAQGYELPLALVLSDGERTVRVLIDRWMQVG